MKHKYKIVKYDFNDNNHNLYEFSLKNLKTHNTILGFYFTNNKEKENLIIYKEVSNNKISFYDKDFTLLYSYEINNGKINSFINYDETLSKSARNCYKNCRDKAVAELESDFISDLACSINPCGIAVAIYCKGKCSGWW